MTFKEFWTKRGCGFIDREQHEETWQAAQKALADDLLDYAQHDSWRCGYNGECHCGLNQITEKYGLPAVPLPEKGGNQ